MTDEERNGARGLRIAVIGAGAAGMMAAGIAAAHGADVTVFEKNGRVGQKLLITGKGRCNVTNRCDLDTLMANIPGNGRFLYSAFSRMSPDDIIGFFETHGVPMKTERGSRVFPESDRASDVVRALSAFVRENGGRFALGEAVSAIETEEGRVSGIRLKSDRFLAFDRVMIATGGLSYPATGTTGDGYRMAEALGHSIVAPLPSLVPLETEEEWVADVSGLSLKNVALTMKNRKGKTLYTDFGEMLFTHFGLSGPMILSASRHLHKERFSGCMAEIDLKPALDEATLDRRILRDFEAGLNRQFKNSLGGLLPSGLVPIVVELSGIPGEKPLHAITKEERLKLLRLLKALPLRIRGARPVAEAIVTAGGVSVREVQPATMESKLVAGLYFGGEVLDVDAYTGGFNLTIAFATGHLAGLAMVGAEE